MVIALWVVIIHLIELAIIGAFLLIRRNNALEKAFIEQQQYIDAIGIIAADGEAFKGNTNFSKSIQYS